MNPILLVSIAVAVVAVLVVIAIKGDRKPCSYERELQKGNKPGPAP